MDYNEYGGTGKLVSAIGFGGMRFDVSKEDEENADLIRYAFSRGINYFDTAPGYCDDKSEDIYGLAFKKMEGRFWVSTKGMPVDNDTADKAVEAVKKSLGRLVVPKIHFYHVWCVRKMDHYRLAMKPGGQYEGLLRCREQGLIDHIVISTHLPGEDIRLIVEEGNMEGVLLGMNILNFPYRWAGAKAAWEKGWGVVAMNPLGGGIIPQHEDKLAFLAAGGETPTEAALRFALACPQITVTLVGFTTREHVDAACRAADRVSPFADADLDRIRKRLSAAMDSVCTGCGYCAGCPQNIPVAAYMQFYNRKQMFAEGDEEMRKALAFDHDWGLVADRKAEAAECVECGRCEEACTQHLNIVERLKEIAEWERAIRET